MQMEQITSLSSWATQAGGGGRWVLVSLLPWLTWGGLGNMSSLSYYSYGQHSNFRWTGVTLFFQSVLSRVL